jgi:hypothetical protein
MMDNFLYSLYPERRGEELYSTNRERGEKRLERSEEA